MHKSWLVCVLLGTLAWGQAAPGTPSPAQPVPAPGNMAKPQAPAAPADTSAAVPADAAVITVHGVCPSQPKTTTAQATTPKTTEKSAAKPPAADCKTVITKAEFEKMANALSPVPLNPQQKKQLAGNLSRFIPMSNEAKKKGLDKTSQFAETVKYAKMQILTSELVSSIQKEGANVPPEEIASYYKEHPEAFEQFNLDRLYVPRTKQGDANAKEEDEKDEKLSEDAQKAKQAAEKAKADEAEQAMTKLAQSLRDRAGAGEDFVKLQKEAFEAAGMKIESPTVNLAKVRRNGLPPAHAAVFDLKVGEVSQVISESGGHYIYKVNSKQQPTLDQVKEEIHGTLQNQRTRDMMDKMSGSFKVDTNEAYFGPAGPGMAPPQRMPNPRMAPGPMAPAQPQTPPPAPPAAKPN